MPTPTLTNPKIYNKTLTLGDTEYSQALTAYPVYFEIRCRTLSDIKVSFVSGQSGTTYFTIPGGSTWFSKGRVSGSKILYMQSPDAGVVAEVIEWS